MLKQTMAFLLCGVLLLTMLPAQVFASEAGTEPVETVTEPAAATEAATEPTEPVDETTVPTETVEESPAETTAATEETVYVESGSSDTLLSVTDSGYFGNNLLWILEGNTLTIAGQASTPTYSSSQYIPWYSYKDQITTVVIEEGVTGIGQNTFADCTQMTSVTIPSTVTFIEGLAFQNCYSLTAVTIPEGVTRLSGQVFYNCSGLTSVTLPTTLTSFRGDAFQNCNKLTEVIIPEAHSTLKAVDNVVFSKDGLVLQWCPAGRRDTYEVPAGTKSISDYAFVSCNMLTNVITPDGLTEIRDRAFAYCSMLQTINIPEGVEYLGEGVFYSCKKLSSVAVPGTVNEIQSLAFYGCYKLKQAEIGAGVQKIGRSAFFYCSDMTSITLPEGLTVIGETAFYDCSGLQEIKLPLTLTTIEVNAFQKCTGLTQITIPGKVVRLGGAIFTGCTNLAEIYFRGDAPVFGNNYIFNTLVATVYYPEDNTTWTNEIGGQYAGTITWVPYDPEVDIDIYEPPCRLNELTDADYMAFSTIAYLDLAPYEGKTVKQALKALLVQDKDDYSWYGIWYKMWNSDQKIRYSDLCNHIAQWKICKYKDDSDDSGFYAVAFENNDGEVIVAYRGSTDISEMLKSRDGWEDWAINDFPTQIFNVVWASDNQYEIAFDFFETFLKEDYDLSSLAVTGHSLGGGLGSIVSARYGCKGVTFNAICILDAIYDYLPWDMGENFNGIGTWNFVDHANQYDVLAGMYEYYWWAEDIKPLIAHKTNTDLVEVAEDLTANSNLGKLMESMGDLFSCHGMKTYATRDASGRVCLTEEVLRSNPSKPVSKLQGLLRQSALDLGTSSDDLFDKAISAPLFRTSFGGAGMDEIYTGVRKDLLIGGPEADTLDGGWGDDTYIYYKGDGADTIFDVGGTDKISLRNFTVYDEIEAMADADSDYIHILCNGEAIISIYKKSRDNRWDSGDTFLVHMENSSWNVDITDLFSRKVFNKHIDIQCPVSIEILDSAGNVVYTVADGQTGSYYTDYGNFYVYEEEGGGYGKTLDLVEGYSARIVGEDTGTMEIDYRDVTDSGVSETPVEFTEVPVSKQFAATFDQTEDGELVLKADTDGDDVVDTTIEPVDNTIPGDLNGDDSVDDSDVEYLLWNTLFPELYPISVNADFDNDGAVSDADVEYLLWHTLFPDLYPLN